MWPTGRRQSPGLLQWEKNATGRQLARVSAIHYHETLWSDLFPGNRSTVDCLEPAILGVETSLELAEPQRRRTVYRLDGGAGTDGKLRWLLQRGYQVVAKGFSGRRAFKLGQQVTRWDHYRPDAWLGSVVPPVDYGRPVQVIVKRWQHKDTWKHSFYVTTLKLPSKTAVLTCYNLRGGAEVEQFREDKAGLFLSARRKRSFAAQKALIRLTDLAHNLLADFRYRGLADSPFANWGLKRIVRDLLEMQGRLYFEGSELKRIELLATHPYAKELRICLERYCATPFPE